MNKVVILSTKKLDNHHKNLLEKSNFEIIEKDFIHISSQSFDISDIKTKPTLLLFTSQNAVKSVIKNKAFSFLKKTPVICVGKKTKELLSENSFKVLECQNYAVELAPIIVEKYYRDSILFFSGNIRSNILPDAMKFNHINFEEIVVYKNTENTSEINKNLDAIFFMSPSAVKSFVRQNKINQQVCFCIGKTTAKALEGKTKNIVIAKEQTIESLIDSCIDYFKH